MKETVDALERALGKLEQSIKTVLDTRETPMAANLGLMAVMADVFYIKKNASTLYDSWKQGLFFIGDTGSVVRLEVWASRLEDAVLALEQHVKRHPLLPSFHVAVSRGKDEEGNEIPWRIWHYESMVGRDGKKDKNIDEEEYAKLVEPTATINLWYFFEKEFHELFDKEIKDVGGYEMTNRKEFFRDISLGGSKLWIGQLRKEVKTLCGLLVEMEDMKKGLYRTLSIEEQEQAMEHLYARIKEGFEK
mgnify:CR=1 FL=1